MTLTLIDTGIKGYLSKMQENTKLYNRWLSESQYILENNTDDNLVNFRCRIIGNPPDKAITNPIVNPNISVAEFKRIIQKEYKLLPLASLQLIFKGKFLSDYSILKNVGFNLDKDIITIMAVMAGG